MLLVVKMDMPRNCSGCCLMGSPNCPYDGSKAMGTDYPNCPIIGEIPDKHGRCIDADELLASDAIDWGEEAWNGINHAPVVLEAST